MTLNIEQEELLSRIKNKSDRLAQRRDHIRGRIESLPVFDELINRANDIQLPEERILAQQISEHLLGMLITPFQQLKDAQNTLEELDKEIENRLEELEGDIEQLINSPKDIQESFDESDEKIKTALDHLKDVVTNDLLPQWSEMQEIFQTMGETSLEEFEKVIDKTQDEMGNMIVETVRETFDRKISAVIQVRDKTISLIGKTEQLAEYIETICTTLASSGKHLSKGTNHTNLGVNKIIDTLNEVNELMRRTLSI